MFTHPHLASLLAQQREREMLAQASQWRSSAPSQPGAQPRTPLPGPTVAGGRGPGRCW